MKDERFERNIRFFGDEGQRRISSAACTIVGIGGLGTHLVQQLALLGVQNLSLIDSEEIDVTNRNRYVGLQHDDAIPGTRKVDIGERLAYSISPTISVTKVCDSFVSEAGYAAILQADYVFGCLDSEGARLILNEVCSVYARLLFDLATDIIPGDPPNYGGRVCAAMRGESCVYCMDVIDVAEAGRDLGGEVEQRNRDAIYGVNRQFLSRSGPSVVSLNGVVASLAVTEFVVTVTGLRPPQRLLTYHGRSGKVTASVDDPQSDCWYCKGLWGRNEQADVERYIRSGMGEWLR